MKAKNFLLLLFLIPLSIFGNHTDSLNIKGKPLDLPISFSGNYGELRGGRFHAGLDFRVGGKVGDRIYSIDEGYLYRVTVSPSGYGNGVYIKHTDGTLSVYGHLLEFAPEIEAIVKNKQYSEKKFAVNVFFTPDEFPVSSHQFIGKVGNSGSSAAPHLHLEVRDSLGEGPLNPIAAGYFNVSDNVPPIIQRVNFYSFQDSTGVPETSLIDSFSGKASRVIEVGERTYVAIDAVDKQFGTVAKLSVEKYEVFLDDNSIFCFKLGNYSFKEQESFNSLIEYGESISSGNAMIKSFVEPGNSFYPDKITCENRGLIVLKDNEIHSLRVEVCDMFGNCARRNFKIRRGGDSILHEVPKDIDKPIFSSFVPWFAPYAFANSDIRVALPVRSLFSSIIFSVDTVSRDSFACPIPHTYSKIWRICDSRIALKKGAKIEIPADVPVELEDKALIVSISSDGKISSIGGKFIDGRLYGRMYSFGNMAVAVDTVAPLIVPRFKSPSSIGRSSQAAFTIKDELSGIGAFNATIDGEWVIARYDQKYDKLWIVLDPEVVTRGGKHTLMVVVSDKKDNSATYNCEFIW